MDVYAELARKAMSRSRLEALMFVVKSLWYVRPADAAGGKAFKGNFGLLKGRS